MHRKSLMLLISLVLFGTSFLTLVAAMIFHAVLSDGFIVTCIIAGAAAALALAGIAFACLYGKEKGKENVEEQD